MVHRETWPIRSKRFRGWLRRCYEATGGVPGAHAISAELDLLEGRAQFDAPERSIHARVPEHEGLIYLDLAADRWRAIEVGPEGWRVQEAPPVRFRRPAGMLPLPFPEKGGSIEELLPLLNLSSRSDFSWIYDLELRLGERNRTDRFAGPVHGSDSLHEASEKGLVHGVELGRHLGKGY
jgi:hypothetical protein